MRGECSAAGVFQTQTLDVFPMKTNSSHTLPHGRQSGGLILNVGIGIVLGLLAALLAVFLVMKGGPFKDHANTNTIAPQTGQAADPNTPLYGAPAQPIDPAAAANKTNANTGGEGVGALTGNSSITDTAPAAKSATKETAKPVATPASDPVAAMINAATGNKTAPPAEKKPAAKTEPAPDVKPTPKSTTNDTKPVATTDSKPKVSNTTSVTPTPTTKTTTTTTTKVTKPAPKTTKTTTTQSTGLPKEVKPATAP